MNTYNSDTSYRAQAEDALAQYLCTPGSLYSLLMFLGSTQVNRDLRQAAGIAVKNKIKSNIITIIIIIIIIIIINYPNPMINNRILDIRRAWNDR